MINTSFFSCVLALFLTLLIFVLRWDTNLKGVLSQYPMYSSLSASRHGPSTAWRMSRQRFSSTHVLTIFLHVFLTLASVKGLVLGLNDAIIPSWVSRCSPLDCFISYNLSTLRLSLPPFMVWSITSSTLCYPRVRAKVVGYVGIAVKTCMDVSIAWSTWGSGFPIVVLHIMASCLWVKIIAFEVYWTLVIMKRWVSCLSACRGQEARPAGVSWRRGKVQTFFLFKDFTLHGRWRPSKA